MNDDGMPYCNEQFLTYAIQYVLNPTNKNTRKHSFIAFDDEISDDEPINKSPVVCNESPVVCNELSAVCNELSAVYDEFWDHFVKNLITVTNINETNYLTHINNYIKECNSSLVSNTHGFGKTRLEPIKWYKKGYLNNYNKHITLKYIIIKYIQETMCIELF
jgi:hypothetical protein